jgi:ADP-ribose pyrophosphatase YjhB (NUDIX family)
MELGETLAQACLRELVEETGLKAEVVRLIGVYSDTAGSLHYAQGKEWHTVRVSLLCRAVGGELRPSPETSELGYFPVDSLPSMITDHPRRIRDARLGLQEAVIA